ncbi:MAG: Ig-like domain-containing protein, partial [Deltaproteobacteria bacterium]|nr:Ig-like domain-containing protein [Deltaproteobacteria bacterium]
SGGSGATDTGGASAPGGMGPGGTVGSAGAGGAAGAGGKAGVSAPSLLMVVSEKFPAAEATGICSDLRLRLTFTVPVAAAKAGRINVWKASDPSVPADSIDLGATGRQDMQDMIGGRRFFQNSPVFIDGMVATIYLHRSKLLPNETYYVTVDSEVFTDAMGLSLGHIADPAAWRFTTRAASPASADKLVVSLENMGDFCSVQGAIDAIPAANTAPVTVTIKNGTYREIVFINGKNGITLHGEDRKLTKIAYANNEMLNVGTAYRAMVEVERSNDLVIENLTLHNLTPQNGGQAEALRIEAGDRAILRDLDLLSFQDTLLISGRAYVTNCFIEGNVDFIWGRGTVLFEKCEIKTVLRKGYNVQARNTALQYGYVFVDSKLTSSPGITDHFLARVDGLAYPSSHVAYINCEMGSHISPLGWLVTNTVNTSLIRYWEYKSVDPSGAPIDVTRRIAASKQLTDAEAAMMRDKATVFGGTPPWVPMP